METVYKSYITSWLQSGNAICLSLVCAKCFSVKFLPFGIIMLGIPEYCMKTLLYLVDFVFYFLVLALSSSILQGQNGSHFEPKPVPPPLPNKCDWEIDPSELDFSTSAMIGKV